MNEQDVPNEKMILQLGDIIQIVAPSDPQLHEQIYLIDYIDKTKIELIDENAKKTILLMDQPGLFNNESIINIDILGHSASIGYAKQHKLVPGTWVDLYFTGDIPFNVTGKITNLEEDMIEISSYPEKEFIYIDFAYKGIPKDIPLSKIIIRNEPIQLSKEKPKKDDASPAAESSDATIDIIDLDDDAAEDIGDTQQTLKEVHEELLELDEAGNYLEEQMPVELFEDHITNEIFTADQIVFGEELQEITQLITIPEDEQRFSIEKQTQDLLDDILSRIPNVNRTDAVLNNIYKLIDRFKELRADFSVFDNKGNVTMPDNTNPDNTKPLLDVIENLSQKLFWLLPVVSLKKKIYDNDNAEDDEDNEYIINSETHQFYTSIKSIVKTYNEGSGPNDQNKYKYLIKEFNNLLSTYEPPNYLNNYLKTAPVNTTITAIIDNNDNMYSNAIKSKPSKKKDELYGTHLIESRFLTQEYNVGLTGLESMKLNNQTVINTVKNITPNDILTTKSLLILPQPTIRFSHINLPSTGIFTKANLDKKFLHYWRFLNEKTFVSNKIIDDLNQPIDYKKESFAKDIKNYILDESVTDENKYTQFLQTIIPQTIDLLTIIKPYVKGPLSVMNVISYLEPFMVYQKHISITQYNEITQFINTKIDKLKKEYLKTSKAYNYITNPSYKNKNEIYDLTSYLNNLFILNNDFKIDVIKAYGLNEEKIKKITIAEFLQIINKIDNGRLFNVAISILSANLMLSKNINESIIDKINLYINSDADDTPAPAVPSANPLVTTDKCKTIQNIAKRYIELDELEDDNNSTDVYYDKKYDPTYYSMLEDHKNKLIQASTEDERKRILISILINNNGLSEINARREAQAILTGKRIVEEGDYAILELHDDVSAGTGTEDADNDNRLLYYERKNNQWILNTDINKDTFIDNNSKSICNILPTCMIDKNNPSPTACDKMETIGKDLKDHNLQKMMDEYDIELTSSKEQLTTELWSKYNYYSLKNNKIIKINENNSFKYDKQKYNLSLTAQDSKGIISPHAAIRDLILGQADFAKRQVDVLKFSLKYTIEPTKQDNPYWLYCIDTHSKLLPLFIFKLAKTFVTNPNEAAYINLLEKICAEQGTLSDDGDSFVDKYSGYTIRKIDFATNEEYTAEGFKNISHEILEADLDDSIIQEMKKQKVFENPQSKLIVNVLKTMSRFMGINIDSKYEFIIRNVVKQIELTVPSKKKYEAALLKSKSKQSYEDVYNQYLLLITLSYFLIAIQINIPGIKTRKTHPGCIRSFSGFPINGTDDKSALKYVACVASKMEKKSIKPWDAIAKLKEKDIMNAMEEIINKYVLNNDEVQDGIQLKLNYLVLNKNVEVPEIHSIRKWNTFLPPLQNLNLGVIENVSAYFKTELLETMKKNSKKQENMIHILRSKIIRFSMAIQELVGKTVHKKAAILTNSLEEPFLENACCHDADYNTLSYFIKEQPDILNYNKTVKQLAEVYDSIQLISKPSTLVDPSNTKPPPVKIPEPFSEETIYRAFIVLCKYGSNQPILDTLKPLCSSKPIDFNTNDALEESILKLKRDGKLYNNNSLTQLLNIVNKTNLVQPNFKKNIKNENLLKLKDLLLKIKENTDIDVPRKFVEMFSVLINEIDINDNLKMTKPSEFTGSAILRNFKNYLAQMNEEMNNTIIEFVKRSTKKKSKNIDMFIKNINTITNFKTTGNEEETIHKMSNFIQNALRDITRVFPNMIINKVSYEYVKIPAYLNLSTQHKIEIGKNMNNQYSQLYEFYDDKTIVNIMDKFIKSTSNIQELIKNTILFGGSIFDNRFITMLYQFYFYSTLSTIIKFAEDDDFIKELVQKEKQENEQISKNDFDDNDEDTLASEIESSKKTVNALETDEIIEFEILVGQKKTISDKLVNVLVTFMQILNKNKSAINYNYSTLMEKINRSKEKEKDMMTTSFKNMTNDELIIQDIMKNHRLEKWNVGLQKGLFKYQATTYDEEYLKRIELQKFGVDSSADMTNIKGVGDDTTTASNIEITNNDDTDILPIDSGELEYEETLIDYPGEDPSPDDDDDDYS